MNGTKDFGIYYRNRGIYLYSQCRYNDNWNDYQYSEIRLDNCLGDKYGKIYNFDICIYSYAHIILGNFNWAIQAPSDLILNNQYTNLY